MPFVMMPDAGSAPVAARIVQQGATTIVHDPVRLPTCDPDWFEPDYWRARGLVQAEPQGRGSAWLVRSGIGDLVLRHYRRGGLVARVSRDRYLWTGPARTRALREFVLLRAARAAGLAVPGVVAARWSRSGMWYRADLLMDAIADTVTLAARVARDDPAIDWRAIGRAVASLHRQGIWHADLNAHNVLFDADGRVWLVDFDRARIRRPAESWRRGNLERLRRSLAKLGAAARSGFDTLEWPALLEAHADTMRGDAGNGTRPAAGPRRSA